MVDSGRIRILTDSVSDIPKSLVDKYSIGILPIYISVNQKQILDDGTLDRDWFYTQLASISSKPKTAAPSPHEFKRAYGKLVSEGADTIIGLFASASLSSIFDHATIAAREFEDAAVHLVDTQQISMGLGWVVISAAEALQNGASIAEVKELVYDLRQRTYIMGVLNSMDYLHRSGRVSWTAAYVGDKLRIKPVISFRRGEAQLVRKVRSRHRAIDHVVSTIGSIRHIERLAILHSNADRSSLAFLQEQLAPFTQSLSVPMVNIGSVFASHVGPGCLGVAYVESR